MSSLLLGALVTCTDSVGGVLSSRCESFGVLDGLRGSVQKGADGWAAGPVR